MVKWACAVLLLRLTHGSASSALSFVSQVKQLMDYGACLDEPSCAKPDVTGLAKYQWVVWICFGDISQIDDFFQL